MYYEIILNLINTETGKITPVRRLFNTDSVAKARVTAERQVNEFNGESIVIDSPMRQEIVSITDYSF